MDNDIAKLLQDNYSIGTILGVEATKQGSGNTFTIFSDSGKYIVKINERLDFVAIHDKVQLTLSEEGYNASRIFRTNKNELSVDGLVLYEFLEGKTIRALNSKQMENSLLYLKSYNSILKNISFSENEIELKNHWDLAKSFTFITNDFENAYLNNCDFPERNIIIHSISTLKEGSSIIEKQSRQLIHGDLGAENFLFDGDKVYAIIDFTPEYDTEIYSLCQFTYWNVLWNNNLCAKNYISNNIVLPFFGQNTNQETFYLTLLKASLYRFIAPFIDMRSKQATDFRKLNKRIEIIERVLKML